MWLLNLLWNKCIKCLFRTSLLLYWHVRTKLKPRNNWWWRFTRNWWFDSEIIVLWGIKGERILQSCVFISLNDNIINLMLFLANRYHLVSIKVNSCLKQCLDFFIQIQFFFQESHYSINELIFKKTYHFIFNINIKETLQYIKYFVPSIL